MLYFGYGSNLNPAHWQEWCRRHGFDDNLLTPVGRGYLIDHHLVFPRRSYGWGGGVLGLTPLRGAVVEGMLFEVGVEQLKALDLKEGVHVGAYDRKSVKVQTEDGQLIEAVTYFACEDVPGTFVHPSARYIRTVAAGYDVWGLPQKDLAAAVSGWPTHSNVSYLAVYGTLRDGSSRGHVMDRHTVSRKPCTLNGELVDFGDYPGLVRTEVVEKTVHAEAIEIRDMTTAIEECDRIEGFGAPDCPYNLFERRLTLIEVSPGNTVRAWYYQFEGSTAHARVIETGDWHKKDLDRITS